VRATDNTAEIAKNKLVITAEKDFLE